MMPYHVLIPARLESTRLPNKALADVLGRPLIVRVLERALQSRAESVHVATDSDAIAAAVESAGGQVVRTRSGHPSGTSRLAEAATLLGLDDEALVVNLQGDEPAVPVACIEQLAGLLERNPSSPMATLWVEIESRQQWLDPNVVKLVADRDGRALYFSRAPIPAVRDADAGGADWPRDAACRHIGLYGYRAAALHAWSGLADSRLERLESLEQLRALEAGWSIVAARAVEPVPPGVDTHEDLEATRRWFAGAGGR